MTSLFDVGTVWEPAPLKWNSGTGPYHDPLSQLNPKPECQNDPNLERRRITAPTQSR